jgi:hypothetical protein
VETPRDLDAAFEWLVPKAARIAYLLTGRQELAERLAIKSFQRSFGTWQNLREGDALETTVLKGVVEGARRRSLWLRAGRIRRDEQDDLWGRFLALPFRHRAALVLKLEEGMEDELAADLLQCSTTTLGSLVASGTRRVFPTRSPEPEQLLRGALEARARDLDAGAGFSKNVLRGIRLRRALTSLGVLMALPLLAVGAYAATRGLVALSREDDAATAERPQAFRVAEEDHEGGGSLVARRRQDNFTAACPAARSARPFGDGTAREAEVVALAFNKAVLGGDSRAVDQLATASGKEEKWAHTETSRGLVVAASRAATSDARVIITCGSGIAKRSWKVVVHDANGVTAAGLATFYLVRLPEGWRVWGSYDGGW